MNYDNTSLKLPIEKIEAEDYLPLNGTDYIEFYVGSAKMVAYWFSKAMGLKITAYKGPETGCRDRSSYLLEKDQIKFVISSPLQPSTADMQLFLQSHG